MVVGGGREHGEDGDVDRIEADGCLGHLLEPPDGGHLPAEGGLSLAKHVVERRGVGGQDGLELDADAHRSRLLREEAEGSLEAGDGPLVLRRHRHFRRRRALSLALSLSEVEPSRSLSPRYFVCDVIFLFGFGLIL